MLSYSVARSCRHQRRHIVRVLPVRWKSSACELVSSHASHVEPIRRTRLDLMGAHLQEDRYTSRQVNKESISRQKEPAVISAPTVTGSESQAATAPTENRRFLHELPPLQELELWAEDAQEMLQYTLEHQIESMNADFVSTQYLAAISAWVQCAKKHSKDITRSVQHAERAHNLLLEWHNEKESLLPPPWIAHERVLHAWYKVSRKDDATKLLASDPQIPAARAREILDHFLERNYNEAAPTLFHNVIELCCKVTTPKQASSNLPQDSLARAELFLEQSLYASSLLERLEEQQEPQLDKSTRKSYKTVLRALSRTAKTASEAIRIDIAPEQYKKSGNTRDANNERAIQIAEQASRESIRLLRRMQRCHGEHVTRNFHYTEAIRAWSLVATHAGAKRAYALLREATESPHVSFNNTLPYTLVLNAYAQVAHTVPWSKEAPANKALQILNGMEKEWLEYQSKNDINSELSTPNNNDASMRNDGSSDEQHEEELVSTQSSNDAPLPPDAVCYSTVLNALARTRVRRNDRNVKVYPAEVATSVLDRMEQLYKTKKLPGQANLFCHGNVIKAWSHHEGDWDVAAKQSQQVLERMEDCFTEATPHDLKSAMPHISVWYNTVMRLIATKSKLPDAPQRVESILIRMEELYHDSVKTDSAIVVAPDSRSYHAAITAWARNGSTRSVNRAHSARQVLDRMLEMHQYQQALLYTKGSDNDDMMFSCRPTVHCYNGVLIACSYTLGEEDKLEALRIAYEVFQELCESPHATPDAGTFGRMIQCFYRFLPPGQERDHDVSEMFRMCCQYGEVNEYVLNILKENGSKRLMESLLGPELAWEVATKRRPAISMLPQEWTRKIK